MHIGKNENILILGGDERMVHLAKYLKDKGYMVSTYGHENSDEKNIEEYEKLEYAISKNEVIIGPIPFNFKDKINMKISKKSVITDEFIKMLKSGKKLFLGHPDQYFIELAKNKGIEYYNYNNEKFKIINAAITAEDAVFTILKESDMAIRHSNILILGYGRIGKILSNYLKAFNAKLFIAVRKDRDLHWININGCKGIKLEEIESVTDNINVVINTIPSTVLYKHIIDRLDKKTIIIDLASKPGGLDHSYAQNSGIRTIHALGLPGKISPKSAAIAIYDAILFLN